MLQVVHELVDEEEGLNDLQSNLWLTMSLPGILSCSVVNEKNAPYHVEIEVTSSNQPTLRQCLGNQQLLSQFHSSSLDCEAVSNLRSVERLETDIAFTPAFLQNLDELLAKLPTVSEEIAKGLPWYDTTGNINLDIIRHFLVDVATTLTEYPQATVSQFQLSSLQFLSKEQLSNLLECFVSIGILKKHVVTSRKVRDPCEAKKMLWGTSQPSPMNCHSSCYYSMNFQSSTN
jgi:hypothetical protein